MSEFTRAWGERIDRRSRLKPLSTARRDVRGDRLPRFYRAGRKQSGADGVAASLGERKARERAAERDATKPGARLEETCENGVRERSTIN